MLYLRSGRTSANFKNLMDGGRLDIMYQCILTSIFKSQAHRHDVIFHAILNGPPNAPLHVQISGEDLRNAHIDESSWEQIIRNVLHKKTHAGITIERCSLQEIIKKKHQEGSNIFLLDSKGDYFQKSLVSNDENNLFVVGDHVGLSRNEEGFIMRYGRKLSLGREKYLAASCIDIINYLLDSN